MAIEVDSSLRPEALREIERGLRRKLEAFDLSDAFIERTIDDAIQKGVLEYLRARERGDVVENRVGFVVRAAFLRAIDELRREARRADGATLDAIIDTGRIAAPPADEAAMADLQAQELRDAVRQLTPEEQQVLRLHYLEELSAEASGRALYCSERTYRRRLEQALRKLSHLLDAPVPEPGSDLAIEIGLASWVALRGAQVAISQGPFEQLFGIVHTAQDAAAWAADRARDLAARFGGVGGEKLTALASSGPGRVVGTCVAACVLAVGGAELAGVGQGGDHHSAQAHRARHHREAKKSPRPERVVVASPIPAPEPAPAQTRPKPRASQSQTSTSSASRTEQREQEATEAVRSQQLEGAVVEEAPAPEPAPETSTSSSSGSSPTQIANEQFGP